MIHAEEDCKPIDTSDEYCKPAEIDEYYKPAQECCQPALDYPCSPSCWHGWFDGWDIELRGAGFHPSLDRFQEIYGDWNGEIQFETTKMLTNYWAFFANVTWLHATGRSIGDADIHHSTSINVIPISFGGKFLYNICQTFDLYLGGGITATYFQCHDESPFVIPYPSEWGVGGIVKAGVRYDITRKLFFDLFVDYRFQYDSFNASSEVVRLNTEFDGVSAGIGIGYKL